MHIEQSVLQIIERGKSDGGLYFLPNEQLDRKTYLAVDKVLKCLGGKWNRKAKAHIFESGISDAIDDVLLTGEVIDQQKEFQFFETPNHIVHRLIELAEILPSNSCLEPSAGKGNIAEALQEITDNVACVELNPANAQILVNNGFSVHIGDFLQYNPKQMRQRQYYDRIVMNPPFTRQQDIEHVLKALSHLEKGGILVSVMSSSVTFRQNKKTILFWDTVNKNKSEIVKLPEGSFKISGTMVNAVILKIIT